ncbi:hypothetical protein B0H63DRAFT_86445 [Podospora didyma]|uniref:Uncharacterized protein n=1 Tax=Podospora didyma TaxID=330526 RepID=A0AAE0K1F5_9PEZI|nr:hypothetical protein B0H63DRAFT_86445 [Podospora didyma]
MKFAIIITALIAGVLAAPADQVEERAPAACYHPSSCSTHWSGLCEDYCGSRGFSHMTGSGCGLLSKKCCCDRA